jgi:hypothetical protein
VDWHGQKDEVISMIISGHKAIKALALLLVFSVLHLSSGTTLAINASQGATGKLTTRGNQAINVNGVSANSGDTILSGANISTGDQIGASVNLGSLGSLDIAPNTKLQLDFGSDGTVTVMLMEGCVVLRVKDGTYGLINTSEGKAASNDSIRKEAATLDVCLPKGAPAAIVNQGAAANAGAGAGTVTGTVASTGVSGAVVGGLIAGGAGIGILALIIANRGDDPSPGS